MNAEKLLCAFVAQTPLWTVISKACPAVELDEIQAIIGTRLVAKNALLHEEVASLLEIWRDYRARTTLEDEKHGLKVRALPEPPLVRDMLCREIKMFIDSLRQQACERGLNDDTFLTTHTSADKDRKVLEYVLTPSTSAATSVRSVTPFSTGTNRVHLVRSPSVSSTRCRYDTPSAITAQDNNNNNSNNINNNNGDDTTTPPQSGRSTPSSAGSASLADQVKALHKYINITDIDMIAGHLRQALEQEYLLLLSDVEFLQQSLEDEADYYQHITAGTCVNKPEPSLNDLRELGTKLEQALISEWSVHRNGISKQKHTISSSTSQPTCNRVKPSKVLPPASTSVRKARTLPTLPKNLENKRGESGSTRRRASKVGRSVINSNEMPNKTKLVQHSPVPPPMPPNTSVPTAMQNDRTRYSSLCNTENYIMTESPSILSLESLSSHGSLFELDDYM